MRTKAAGLLLASGLLLGGCHAAHDVAVTSFRVIDAPAAYVRHRIDGSSQTTTTTTTTAATSDVVTPGRPVDLARPSPTPRRPTAEHRTAATGAAPARPSRSESPARSSASPSPQRAPAAPQTAQYPTAKPVPGKPGYVYSPYDPSGGYVDVTGYASGSKAKDPYSQKIFVVP